MRDITARDITARDITARDITARDITARDITARVITASHHCERHHCERHHCERHHCERHQSLNSHAQTFAPLTQSTLCQPLSFQSPQAVTAENSAAPKDTTKWPTDSSEYFIKLGSAEMFSAYLILPNSDLRSRIWMTDQFLFNFWQTPGCVCLRMSGGMRFLRNRSKFECLPEEGQINLGSLKGKQRTEFT